MVAEGSRPVLLVGLGEKPRELAAVLSAVAAVRSSAEGAPPEPERPLGLADLEELLGRRPPEGTLVLDYERVPGEDIGFVRRFLERHTGWRLLVVGDDPSDRRARGLLGLARTQWIPWPPDLDQIGALLTPREGGGSTDGELGAGAGVARSELDVRALLEELLASASLDGGGSPRTAFHAGEELHLGRDRAPLAEGLGALLALARRCAGHEGLVQAEADRAPEEGDPEDTVRIRMDFPAGPLREEEWAGLLDQPFHGAPEAAEAVERAAAGTALLRHSGARVTLLGRRPDRLRLEVHVASSPLGTPAPVG